MDVLVLTLWTLGIIISHLLLRRVVEIDNMNKQLMQERSKVLVEKEKNEIIEISDEDLKKELLEYVTAQEYEIPQKPVFKNIAPVQMSMTEIGVPMPTDATNVIQEFQEERDINTGHFGPLEAYDGNGFAPL